MPKSLPADRLQQVVVAVGTQPGGGSLAAVTAKLSPPAPRRTVAYWLAALVRQGRLSRQGGGWRTRYFIQKDGYKAPPPPKDSLEALKDALESDISWVVKHRLNKLLAAEYLKNSAEFDMEGAPARRYFRAAKAGLAKLTPENLAKYELTLEEYNAWKAGWK